VGALQLSADEVLTTTRAVRLRLDLSRPVEREVIEECARIAQQAPSATNTQPGHLVVVTDADQRAEIGRIYRELAEATIPKYEALRPERSFRGEWFLVEHLAEVPVHVIPCVAFPRDAQPAVPPSPWTSILPLAWSFMLAARARGLGTTWTTIHLHREQEVAELLGIPYDDVRQAALLPLAYTRGTEFKAGRREPVERILHWDGW
jgi:nitroreductase